MVYAEFNGSSGGMGGIFLYAKQTIPFYDSLLFGVILAIVTFSIYFIQESKKGKGDFPVAFAVGSTATSILAIIISMVSGFMSGTTLGIFISITIVSYIWLFYSEP